MVACVALIAMPVATIQPASAETIERTVSCGGLRLTYGMPIGSMGPSIHEQHSRSIIAVAAVTTDDRRARAWLILDESAQPWLALARNTPADLQRLWIFPSQPNFAGPGVQVRWTPVKPPLPKNYRMTDCQNALPYT